MNPQFANFVGFDQSHILSQFDRCLFATEQFAGLLVKGFSRHLDFVCESCEVSSVSLLGTWESAIHEASPIYLLAIIAADYGHFWYLD